MPEINDVETTRRKIKPYVEGRSIAEIRLFDKRPLRLFQRTDRAAIGLIKGRAIQRIRRKGKVLFFDCGDSRMFAVHLGMSGALVIGHAKEEMPSHTRAYWRFAETTLFLFFRDIRRFGKIWIGTEEDLRKDPFLGELGPDALALDLPLFKNILVNRARQLKALLLDQRAISGAGNIVTDETLSQAKLHPARISNTLTQNEMQGLWQALRTTIERLLKSEGTRIRSRAHPDVNTQRFPERFRVYGRVGKPCPRCQTTIIRMIVAARSTFLCLKCQKP